MRRSTSIAKIALPAVLLVGVVWYVNARSSHAVDFNREIRPILNEKCVTCHGGVRRKGDLSLLFRADALAPAKSGKAAIVPGNPGRSELIRRVQHADPKERMPLEHPALSDREVDLLKEWIAQGAPWDPHWAYVAPVEQDLPEVEDETWPETGIDYFVLARLEAENLAPSPPAACLDLIRRVSLDLIGLPPTPEEADAACAAEGGYAHHVDSLLSSPRYGERWAALWLDLARYADSNGFEKDELRVIWKYRDWVIDAFNRDMPFDRFTIEQLAGDLLPNADTTQLIATAFHRNTMTNTEGGTDNEEFRSAAVIDRVNTTFEVWQGTTISCVQCHGHPYDPFRHEEFYKLYAFFNNTKDADRDDNEPRLFEFENADEERGRDLLKRIDESRPDIDEAAYAEWAARLKEYASDGDRPPKFDDRLVSPELIRIAKKADRDPYEEHVLREFFIGVRPEFEDYWKLRRELRDDIWKLNPVTTPIMSELPQETSRRTHVFDRGNWLVHGERVYPDVPKALPDLSPEEPRNRLGLARWLVRPENPLTARVTVNRFWEQLFGAGIVETTEDFGTQGTPPTHPELLDWLALRFQHHHRWSVKGILKEIVTSATYRQSSRVTPELLDHDPQNRLLARGPSFRLSAEQVRDQTLAVSGLLSAKMYGPSVFPPQPPDIWRNPYSAEKWTTSEGEDAQRRGIYTFLRRTAPYPSMLTFDAGSREICLSRRIRTNTPLQSLVTLNDPAFVDAAVALAKRMRVEGGSTVEDRLRRGYRLALLRSPDEGTIRTLATLYQDALADQSRVRGEQLLPEASIRPASDNEYGDEKPPVYQATLPKEAELAAMAVVANAILNLDAFLTKQ